AKVVGWVVVGWGVAVAAAVAPGSPAEPRVPWRKSTPATSATHSRRAPARRTLPRPHGPRSAALTPTFCPVRLTGTADGDYGQGLATGITDRDYRQGSPSDDPLLDE